ncbi:MAG: PAS domain-containing protein [Minicystis sp.]
MLRDEQRRAEEAVRASEERFRVVARATNDAIWEMDLATGEVIRGETFAALFGYRPEEVGKDVSWWYERIHPEDRPRIDAVLAAFRATGGDVCADEYRFRRADGTWAHVFDRQVLMRDASGTPVRAIGAMMDITERKQMEAKLVLADRLASLGTLAAGVAHEINNPLSYVIANIRLVQDRLRALADGVAGADPGATREALVASVAALDEAREGAERVHRIVGDLKTFARAEEDRKGPVDVRRVLEAALHLSEHDVRRRARLVREIEDVPPVLANEARLGQVFLTLVVNAAESIPAGAAESNTVRVSARRGEGSRVVIEVCDSGPGIAAEARGRVFEPFFCPRASDERKGFGLSVCHAIVTAIGGEIVVDGELGRGTCFRVILPAMESAAPFDRNASSRPPPAGSGFEPPAARHERPARGPNPGGRRRAHGRAHGRARAGAGAPGERRDLRQGRARSDRGGGALRRDPLRPDDALDVGDGPLRSRPRARSRSGLAHGLPLRRRLHAARARVPRTAPVAGEALRSARAGGRDPGAPPLIPVPPRPGSGTLAPTCARTASSSRSRTRKKSSSTASSPTRA